MKVGISLSRRRFIRQSGVALAMLNLPLHLIKFSNYNKTMKSKSFEVIIIGGSYSGLASGMALGRALRQVLIIDSSNPCNRQTPYSHNFLTHDGDTPKQITNLAKQQVAKYTTISFFDGMVIGAAKVDNGFEVMVASGETFYAKRLIFATGIRDIMPDIDGFTECWGISALHCPYCHGYEMTSQKTGILSNGEFGFDLSRLISNWTKDLTLFTNGVSTLTAVQLRKLKEHRIDIVEKEVERLEHTDGYVQNIIFKDGTKHGVKAIYSPRPFEQHCKIPEALGCKLTDDGYIRIDTFHKTTIDGVFSCGDNVTRMRTVANAVAMGTTTGMMVNKEIITEDF